jgi:hypothetical protein
MTKGFCAAAWLFAMLAGCAGEAGGDATDMAEHPALGDAGSCEEATRAALDVLMPPSKPLPKHAPPMTSASCFKGLQAASTLAVWKLL